MISNVEPLIKATVNKLHSIWFGSQEPQKPQEPNEVDSAHIITTDELKMIIGQEVKTPQQESLKIKEILGDKVMLEDINGNAKIVEINILKKWINKG
jgi:hypothetical protein